MKKSSIILWCVAALFLVSSFTLIGSNLPAAICGVLLSSVLAFIGYKKQIKYKADIEAALKEQAEREARKRDYEAHHGKITCNVAGVTFKNDDNTSRQRVLSKFFRENGYDAGTEAELQQYLFEGRPAVYVLIEGKIIGNVPKDYTAEVVSIIDRLEIAAVHVRRFRGEEGKLIYNADLTIEYAK
jgi:hypothetical protein